MAPEGTYIGIDPDPRYMNIAKMDAEGAVLERVRLENNREQLGHYLRDIPKDAAIVVEASGNWISLYELMEDLQLNVVLANPEKAKEVAYEKTKARDIDGATLADLLRTKSIPATYIPAREIRDIREMLRYRLSLLNQKIQTKYRVRAIFHRNGIAFDQPDILSAQSQTKLLQFPLRPCHRQELEGYLAVANTLNAQIAKVTQALEKEAHKRPQVQILISFPGLSPLSALTLWAEIGDIRRFPTARQLCSYAGLAPHAKENTPQEHKWIRLILLEASFHAIRLAPPFKSFFQRVTKKHGNAAARMAVARKMLIIIHAMLKQDKRFVIDVPASS